MPGELTYGFRLLFHVPPGRTFAGVGSKRRLKLPGIQGRVYMRKLPPPKRNRFGARIRYVVAGERFRTESQAAECGRKLKTAFGVLAASRDFGIDLGRDTGSSRTSTGLKQSALDKFGVQLRDDVHGLDVFPEHPPVRRWQMEMYGTVRGEIRDYDATLNALFESSVTLKPKQQLALELLNLTHFEGQSKTRFLTLVTVVEVLATRLNKGADLRRLLVDLSKMVEESKLPATDKRLLIAGLGNLKRESIAASCRRFVADLASESDADYFADCYKARSELLHTGMTKRTEVHDVMRLSTLVSRVFVKHVGATV